MYEQHFGLKKRPFRAHAVGNDVFVGPQTATTMAALKKALASPDAIVLVSGAIGAGKSTLVKRTLDAVGDKQLIVSVGRIALDHDEVLELLLREMGVAELPVGTVQRFMTFRRLLREHLDAGTRVFIVVEDIARIGTAALAELEALTAPDAGASEGANIVLMGSQDAANLVNDPQLVRLKQRLRLHHTIQSLSTAELLGYFKHCFRLAGNEFDVLFTQGSSELLHTLSGGIPRIANNLVESVLTAAAENNQSQVTLELIQQVAANDFDLKSVKEDANDSVPELIQDTVPDLAILSPAAIAEPANTAAEKPAAAVTGAANDVPAWERDPTLAQLRPDLDALENAMADGREVDPETEVEKKAPPKPVVEVTPEKVPEIILDQKIQEKVHEAEDALEQVALEAAARTEQAVQAENSTKLVDEPPIKEAAKPIDAEQKAIAVNLTRAKTIDDVDDKMAETLFGEEFSDAAAQVAAMVAADISNDAEIGIEAPDTPTTGPVAVPPAAPAPVAAPVQKPPAAAAPAVPVTNAPVAPAPVSPAPVAATPAPPVPATTIKPAVNSSAKAPNANIENSAVLRMATVRALNKNTDPGPSPSKSPSAGPTPPPESVISANYELRTAPTPAGDQPVSIEDQINTSITQTLRALKVSTDKLEQDDDDEESKGGFFGRFRR